MAETEQVKGVQIGVVVTYDPKTKLFEKTHKLWMETDDAEAAEMGFHFPDEIARMIAKRIKDAADKEKSETEHQNHS